MEEHIVTTSSVLRRGVLFKKAWITGWIFGGLCFSLLSFYAGREVEHARDKRDLVLLQEKMIEIERLQSINVSHLSNAWEESEKRNEFVLVLSEYLKRREEIKDFNSANGPFGSPRPRRKNNEATKLTE